jgi:hypothetical protein
MKDVISSVLDGASKGFSSGLQDLSQYAVVTAAFWTAQNLFQRLAGSINIHSGRSGLLVFGYGAITTLASSKLALDCKDLASLKSSDIFGSGGAGLGATPSPSTPSKDKQNSTDRLFRAPWSTPLAPSSEDMRKATIRTLLLTALAYTVLESKFFTTAVPSSVITLGVFNKGIIEAIIWMVLCKQLFVWVGNRGSVEASGAIATESQRRQIQKLGKLHGCHHCSSRQLLSRSTFIADHMPPTKEALQMNKSFFRKLFGIEVGASIHTETFQMYS